MVNGASISGFVDKVRQRTGMSLWRKSDFKSQHFEKCIMSKHRVQSIFATLLALVPCSLAEARRV
jgi:hypothetical protein